MSGAEEDRVVRTMRGNEGHNLFTASQSGRADLVEKMLPRAIYHEYFDKHWYLTPRTRPGASGDMGEHYLKETALYAAAKNGHADCVELLLNAGADITKTSIDILNRGGTMLTRTLPPRPNQQIWVNDYINNTNMAYILTPFEVAVYEGGEGGMSNLEVLEKIMNGRKMQSDKKYRANELKKAIEVMAIYDDTLREYLIGWAKRLNSCGFSHQFCNTKNKSCYKTKAGAENKKYREAENYINPNQCLYDYQEDEVRGVGRHDVPEAVARPTMLDASVELNTSVERDGGGVRGRLISKRKKRLFKKKSKRIRRSTKKNKRSTKRKKKN